MATVSADEWASARQAYRERAPYSFAVIDDFLPSGVFNDVRDMLVRDGGWVRKNWQVTQLFNKQPPIPFLSEIVESVRDGLAELSEGLDLVKHWAVACHENSGLHVHADNGRIAVNFWMTPDENNLAPEAGGLILYKLRREPEMMPHEFNAMPWAGEYFERLQPSILCTIPYRCNRAVVFDASIFHATERIAFKSGSLDTVRLGVTMAFDDPGEYAARMSKYTTGGVKSE